MSDEFTFDVDAVDVEALDDEAGMHRVYFAIDLAAISGSPEELALAGRIYSSFITCLRKNPFSEARVRVRTLAFGQQNGTLSDLLAPAECPPWEELLDTEYASEVSADSLIALLEQQAAQDELTLHRRSTSWFRSGKTHVSPWSSVVLPASGNAPFKESEVEILTEHRAAGRMWKTHLLNLPWASPTIDCGVVDWDGIDCLVVESGITGWGLRNWDVSPDQVDELFPKMLILDAFWDSDVTPGTTYGDDDFEGDAEFHWDADEELPLEEHQHLQVAGRSFPAFTTAESIQDDRLLEELKGLIANESVEAV